MNFIYENDASDMNPLTDLYLQEDLEKIFGEGRVEKAYINETSTGHIVTFNLPRQFMKLEREQLNAIADSRSIRWMRMDDETISFGVINQMV